MNKYDREFKDEAVAIALNSDRPLTKTALDLGVNCLASTILSDLTTIKLSG